MNAKIVHILSSRVIMLYHMVSMATHNAILKNRGIPTEILISHKQHILEYKT